MVIADFEKKYLDRIRTVLEVLGDAWLNIGPHPYTLGEVKEMMRKGNLRVVDAISEE